MDDEGGGGRLLSPASVRRVGENREDKERTYERSLGNTDLKTLRIKTEETRWDNSRGRPQNDPGKGDVEFRNDS